MTKDEALTMIIASVAMEELALSHIVNAEGEKLQYILGTLPGGPKICASNQEILAVNRSVTELLNTVMQNQILLKGKLEKALEAGGHAPEPPCACGPVHPCKPTHPCEPSCGGESCCQKSAIRLVSQCNEFTWDNGSPLSWKCQKQRGRSIQWSEEAPALVNLDPGKIYSLDYTINVRGPYCRNNTGTVFVKLTPCDVFSDVLPLYFSVKCLGCQPLTLHYHTMLCPQEHSSSCAGLSVCLDYSGGLFVEQASLNIFEI